MSDEKLNEENLKENLVEDENREESLRINAVSIRKTVVNSEEYNEEDKKLNDSKNNINSETDSISESNLYTKLTPYKYVIIVIYYLFNISNGFQIVSFAAINKNFGKFYHLNIFLVDLLFFGYLLLFPIMIKPFYKFIFTNKISLKKSLYTGCILLLIGAILKIFIKFHVCFAFIGQIINQLSQPLVLLIYYRSIHSWVNFDKRNLIVVISYTSKYIGIAIGYLFHMIIFNKNIVNPLIFKKYFSTYLFFEFILVLFLTLPILIFYKQNPSSALYFNQEIIIKENILKIKAKNYYRFIIIIFSFTQAYLLMLFSNFNSEIIKYGLKIQFCTLIIFFSIVFGVVLTIIHQIIIKKKIKNEKIFVIIINSLIIAFLIAVTIVFELTKKQNYLKIFGFLLYLLIIGFSVLYYFNIYNILLKIKGQTEGTIYNGISFSISFIISFIFIIINDIFRSTLPKCKYIQNTIGIILFGISLVLYIISYNKKPEENNIPKKSEDSTYENSIEKNNESIENNNNDNNNVSNNENNNDKEIKEDSEIKIDKEENE